MHLLLLVVVAAACALLLRLPPPDPEPRYRLDRALADRGDGEAAEVALPYRFAAPPGSAPVKFTLAFDRPAGEAGRTWSVLLPRFVNRAIVKVNGTVVLDSRLHAAPSRPDRNAPELATIPELLLRDGRNALDIELQVWGPLGGYLDAVFAGPDEMLRPSYERRVFLFETLPVVFSAWQSILAVLLGVMWLKRPKDSEYGLLAAAMALGGLHAFAPAPAVQTELGGLTAVLVASAPLEAALVTTFVVKFLGLVWPREAWLVYLPGLLIVAAGLVGDAALVQKAYLFLGPPIVFISLFVIAATASVVAVRRGDAIAVMLACANVIVLTFCFHDILVMAGVIEEPILVSRMSYSALLAAIGVGLFWRFATALNEVDSFAGRMVALVRETEAKLRASLALEERHAREAALADERTRLMRDLHDGLGGQLVSIVAMSEKGMGGNSPIGAAARAALRDLRLVIDAMDDIGGDLMLALGAWRERAEAQLRPHGIALEWSVRSREGLPVHPELRPWHVIQILRLLDEAVTNAAKHARPSRVCVRIGTVKDGLAEGHGRIVVEDDGRGFELRDGIAASASSSSRGLANMRRRAALCGATLEMRSGSEGTRLQLDLPTRFPDRELTP